MIAMGLRADRCCGDELRGAADRLHVALSTLGIGTHAAAPKPHADDPVALEADWIGDHIVPRRLDLYPLHGIPFKEGELSVVSPRGVAMLHATFLCARCSAAHGRGSFDPACYIHTLAHMLMGVRCTWNSGTAPLTIGPAALPPLREQPAAEAEWLDAEHDRMVAAGMAETLTAEQSLDVEQCALIASVRVAFKQKPSGLSPSEPGVPGLASAARIVGAASATSITHDAGSEPTPAQQASSFSATLTLLAGEHKPRFVMGLHRTVNQHTPPKGLRYATIHDAVANAPPGCSMRGSVCR
jgi:hypothetical protein